MYLAVPEAVVTRVIASVTASNVSITDVSILNNKSNSTHLVLSLHYY